LSRVPDYGIVRSPDDERKAADEVTEYLVDVMTRNGDPFQTRISGSLVAEDDNVTVYLTDQGVCAVHDADRATIVTLDDSEELRDWLGDDAYVAAMNALGQPAIIDL
jgi:hypothetical protein